MKHLKKIILLLVLVAFIASCENDTSFLEEQVVIEQNSSKENLSARPNISESLGGKLYTLENKNSFENIRIYDYNIMNDDLSYDLSFSTELYYNYSFDYNPADRFIYLLAGEDMDYTKRANGPTTPQRFLYRVNPFTNEITQLDGIISIEGDGRPQNLTFSDNGTLYFVFKNGEINTYDIDSKTMNEFSYIDIHEESQGVGLTYDYDNDRLVYASYGSGLFDDDDYKSKSNFGYYREMVYLFAIDATSGEVDELFYLPNNNYFDRSSKMVDMMPGPMQPSFNSGQTIEYIGNNQVILIGNENEYNEPPKGVLSGKSYEYEFNKGLYTVNLDSQNIYLSDDISGWYKDLMYIDDSDGDFFTNDVDMHPNSNLSEELSFDRCYPGVANVFVGNGSTMADEVDDVIAAIWEKLNTGNHPRNYNPQRQFQRDMVNLLNKWYRNDRVVTDREKFEITKCVRSSRIFERKDV